MRTLIKVFLLLLFTNNLYGQFGYKNINNSITSKYYFKKDITNLNGFVYAIKYLPKGYSKNGNIDYTKEIQKAIDENSGIILPNFPIMINKNGLIISSNRTIIFQNSSKIIFNGLAKGRFSDILKIYNVKNVKIINANIVGSKIKNNQSGEWSAGIAILNSDNVTISNASIKNTWGDGIFIGSENGKFSKNITLENIWIDNARRNGISITSLIDGWIKNVLISNTNGTSPECGIDIEPSLNSEVLKNVNISNIESFNNKAAALSINLTNLNSDKLISKDVSVNIDGFYDNFSGNLVILSFNPLNKTNKVKGKVKLNNIKGENIKSYGLWQDSKKSDIILENNNFKYNKRK